MAPLQTRHNFLTRTWLLIRFRLPHSSLSQLALFQCVRPHLAIAEQGITVVPVEHLFAGRIPGKIFDNQINYEIRNNTQLLLCVPQLIEIA